MFLAACFISCVWFLHNPMQGCRMQNPELSDNYWLLDGEGGLESSLKPEGEQLYMQLNQ